MKVDLKKVSADLRKFFGGLASTSISATLLVLWIVFSVCYIGYDLWQEIKQLPVEQAYNNGKADTLSAVVSNAQTCTPMTVNSALGSAQLVNVACLQQAQAKAAEKPATTEPEKK
jgi:hypothetical protein